MELVIDASVAAKWFLEEKEREVAENLRRAHLDGKIRLAAPGLLFFELANLLVTKKTIFPVKAVSALKAILDMKISFFGFTEGDLEFWVRICRERKISAYDASYLSLAKKLNCDFITSDKKLYEKVKTLKFVKLL